MFGLETGVSIALVLVLIAAVVHWDRRLTRVEIRTENTEKKVEEIHRALDIKEILKRAGG